MSEADIKEKKVDIQRRQLGSGKTNPFINKVWFQMISDYSNILKPATAFTILHMQQGVPHSKHR